MKRIFKLTNHLDSLKGKKENSNNINKLPTFENFFSIAGMKELLT